MSQLDIENDTHDITPLSTQHSALQHPVHRTVWGEVSDCAGGVGASGVCWVSGGGVECGGLGQITAACFTPEELQAEIAAARALTDQPFAVNFALGHRSLDDLLDATLDAGVTAISITGAIRNRSCAGWRARGADDGADRRGRGRAQKAESLGADAVIAVGQEGAVTWGAMIWGTLMLVPRVVDAVKIPVLASGGIGDARGFAAALALGAAGIEMGTRFVATREYVAHAAYKEALIRADERATVVIGERSVGRPGRVLDSPGAQKILAAEAGATSIEELLPLIEGSVDRRGAHDGDLEDGFVWAGQVIGLSTMRRRWLN